MLLEATDLTVRFDGEPVVGPISFQLDAGTITTVSGASGSGKSVLLRALADLVPYHGAVRWRGRQCAEVPAAQWRRHVLWVPQHVVRLPGTGWDNLRAVLPRGEPLDRENIDRWAATLSLSDRLSRPMAQLSGGEAQRIGLIRALQMNPDVLLLDEPAAALDSVRAAAMESLLRRWVADGRGVIWVTHDRDRAARVGDQRLVVSRG